MRRIAIVMADLHCGHKLGLMRPDIELPPLSSSGDEKPWIPGATQAQETLWEWYLSWINEVKGWAGDDEIILLIDGDVCNGNRFYNQVVSTRLADQLLIAKDALRPWLEMKNIQKVRLLASSAAHSFNESSADILVAEGLKDIYKKDVKTYYHGLVEIDGVLIDISHRGVNQGSRKWLDGNIARYYTRSIMMNEIMSGNKPPDLVHRAHYHTWMNTLVEMEAGGKEYFTRAVVSPALCFLTEYSQSVTRSLSHISIGFVGYEIVDGKLLEPKKFIKNVEVRVKEVL